MGHPSSSRGASVEFRRVGQSIARVLMIFLIAILPMGCSSIEPSAERRPAVPVREVAVGGFDSADPDRQRIARWFRRELAARLRESEAFEAVLLPPPPRLPADAVLVTGRMIEVSDSSDALRWLLGNGLWTGRLRAYVEVRDAAGRALAAFEDSRQSGGGMFSTAPWTDGDTDEMTEAMAAGTADAIVRWSKGRGLEPSFWQQVF